MGFFPRFSTVEISSWRMTYQQLYDFTWNITHQNTVMFIYTRIDLKYVQISQSIKMLMTLVTKLYGEGLSTLFLEVESVNLRQNEITCMCYRYWGGPKMYQSKRKDKMSCSQNFLNHFKRSKPLISRKNSTTQELELKKRARSISSVP